MADENTVHYKFYQLKFMKFFVSILIDWYVFQLSLFEMIQPPYFI